MSHSRGKLHTARCCPWCGTATLVRDTFSADTKAEHTHVSYICTVCCTGFALGNSPRVHFANRMFQMDRAQRPPNVPSGPTLTYKIGDIYPPGTLPQIGVAADEELD